MANAKPIIAGMTGAEFLASLNTRNIFNVLDYGAVGDDNTINTVALQYVIELAKIQGGTVYIPSGTYKTGKLTTYANVRIVGDGSTSVLKSIAAEPLIESLYSTWVDKPCGDYGINNIALNGDNIGTIGFNTQVVNSFHMVGISIYRFTSIGLKLHGSLVGDFYNCYISSNYIGVSADGHVASPNLVIFHGGQFMANSKYAMSWNNGLMVKFLNCDFEDNGVSGDVTTGAINYDNGTLSSGDQNLGLIVDSCWFESNHGYVVNIPDCASANVTSIISNSMFISNEEASTYYDIYINGTTSLNKLILRDCILKDGANVKMDGANAIVINDNSFLKGDGTKVYGYGGVSITGGGKYILSHDYYGRISTPQFTAALTDDTPTDAEIDSATGLTPPAAGAGWQCTIKDNNGSGLCYKVESDGTNWQYIKMTKAT